MGQVFLIAVVSALDAGLLTAAVVLLGRPRPARKLGAYLIGGMGFSIIFGLLIVLALHGSNLRLGRSTQGVIEVVAGALLILVAVVEWSGRKVQWHPRRTRKARRRSLGAAEPPRPGPRPRLVVDRVGGWCSVQRARRLLPGRPRASGQAERVNDHDRARNLGVQPDPVRPKSSSRCSALS